MIFLSPKARGEILQSPLVRRICTYDELDSTMFEARHIIEHHREHADGVLIVADTQTGGQGRFNRVWHSPPGGLYFTLVFEERMQTAFTLIVGLAVAEAIENIVHIKTTLNWPNDILFKGKKVAGVLSEIVGDFTIVGVGMNTFPSSEFPPEIEERASTIPISRSRLDELLAAIVTKLTVNMERFKENGFAVFKTTYEKRLEMLGQQISLISGKNEHSGILKGVDDTGAIILDSDGRELTFASAETSCHEFKIEENT